MVFYSASFKLNVLNSVADPFDAANSKTLVSSLTNSGEIDSDELAGGQWPFGLKVV